MQATAGDGAFINLRGGVESSEAFYGNHLLRIVCLFVCLQGHHHQKQRDHTHVGRVHPRVGATETPVPGKTALNLLQTITLAGSGCKAKQQ